MNPMQFTFLMIVLDVLFFVVVFATFGIRQWLANRENNQNGTIQCGAPTRAGTQCTRNARQGFLTCTQHASQEAALRGQGNDDEQENPWYTRAIQWIRGNSTTILYISILQILAVLYGVTGDSFVLGAVILLAIGGISFMLLPIKPNGLSLARGLFFAYAGTMNTVGFVSAFLTLGLGSTTFGQMLNFWHRIPTVIVIGLVWVLLARKFAPYFTNEEEDAVRSRENQLAGEDVTNDGGHLVAFANTLNTAFTTVGDDPDARRILADQAKREQLPLRNTSASDTDEKKPAFLAGLISWWKSLNPRFIFGVLASLFALSMVLGTAQSCTSSISTAVASGNQPTRGEEVLRPGTPKPAMLAGDGSYRLEVPATTTPTLFSGLPAGRYEVQAYAGLIQIEDSGAIRSLSEGAVIEVGTEGVVLALDKSGTPDNDFVSTTLIPVP